MGDDTHPAVGGSKARSRRCEAAPMADETLSPRETAALLGLSLKATQQALTAPARRVLEDLQREILDLRLRLAEAEQEIASLSSGKPSK